jgi:hypothetical protein
VKSSFNGVARVFAIGKRRILALQRQLGGLLIAADIGDLHAAAIALGNRRKKRRRGCGAAG